MAACLLRVRVTPRSSRNHLSPGANGVALARVTAPPVDGAANAAVLELVAESLGVRKSTVALKSGASSRDKLLLIDGLTNDEMQARLAELK